MARPRATASGDVAPAPAVFIAPLTVQSVDSALALGRAARAQTVVVGRFFRGADSLRVVASTYQIATGQRIGETYRSAAPTADPRAVFDTLARQIMSTTSIETVQPRESRP
jgi:hypothetical protein